MVDELDTWSRDLNSLFLELICANLCILIIKKKDILSLGIRPTQGLDKLRWQQKVNIQLIFQDQIENFV